MIQRILDLLHEHRIDRARRRFVRYPTKANLEVFKALLVMRSPGQVARMETTKGLKS